MKTVKCKLINILDKNKYLKLLKIIDRSNNVSFITYYFIRLFIIDLFENNKTIPIIDKSFIKTCISTLLKDTCGPKSKNSNNEKLNEFYNTKFVKLLNPKENIKLKNINNYKFDGTNLSYILNELVDEIITVYQNNIKMNFIKYLNQYINRIYKSDFTTKELNKELLLVKKDFVNNSLESDKKYHKWIKKTKKNMFPKQKLKTLYSDINSYPFNYLLTMLQMNKVLEKDNNLKMFQVLPLRTDIKNKYITINTPAIIDIFYDDFNKPLNLKMSKGSCLKNVRKIQHKIWNNIFTFNKKLLKLTNHKFNYLIQTDGFAVSLNFINNEEYIKNENKKDSMLKASINAKNIYKNKTKVEIEKIKEEKLNKKINNNEKYKNTYKEKIKGMTKDEKNLLKLKKQEFNYVEDLIKNDDFKEKLKNKLINNKVVCIDPGKRTLLTMGNDKKEFFNYRNRRRLKETKRLKINKMVLNKMNQKKKLNNYITKLAQLNSKSVNFKTFGEYFKLKYKIRNYVKNKLKDLNEFLQKQKWFSYINTQRHESKLLNEIEKFYGKKSIMLMGDWSNKGKLKFISTPNMKLKRLFKRKFETYLIDEFRTSKYDYLTGEENKKLKVELTEKQKSGLNKKINELKKINKPKKEEKSKLNKLIETLKHNTQELYSVFTWINEMDTSHLSKILTKLFIK